MIMAIAGLLKPNGGSIQLGGIDTYSRRDEVRRTMGLFLQGAEPYDGLTLRRNLLFMAKLEGISDAEKKVDEIIERCDLKECADETISVLSRELKRKLMIAQTLINKPTLLLLEDPLSGLKDNEAGAIGVLLKGLSRWEGITIICSGMSADDLGFCNRIGVMRDGLMETVIERGGEGVE
jgi:ABC-2 type transport system ATP-binding protein